MATAAFDAPVAVRPGLARLLLYLLLGFSAGLPFYMFSTVLALRLTEHGVGLVVIGFFAWVTLLPTFKFLWAPLLDRYDVPGFARFWGKRRGWIMLSQLGSPYQSSKGRAGRGLGLFLVVNVMRKLGGSVTARNLPQGGAQVALALPLAALEITDFPHA